MVEHVKILFVNSEIFPYMPESPISLLGRFLPQTVQEEGMEIRTFMPKFGTINERRNQLHEVIRLSGMNIIVNDMDRPLIIKVASITQARMQVYFIENDDYFKRKAVYTDETGKFFADNDERAIFFAKGMLETVKKLRWQPTIVHCSGWMSYLAPMYLKLFFQSDPIFANCKVIVSLYDEISKEKFSSSFAKKAMMQGMKPADVELINNPNGINLAKLAVQYADGVVYGSKNLNKSLTDFVAKSKLPVLQYTEVTAKSNAYTSKYIKFYDKFIKE